jgi:hypothetical protein
MRYRRSRHSAAADILAARPYAEQAEAETLLQRLLNVLILQRAGEQRWARNARSPLQSRTSMSGRPPAA